MKYVIAWEGQQTEEQAARSLQVFSKWTPDENVTFHQFVSRIDGRGGFSVVETDDPSLVAKDMALFAPFFEFSVYPVLDIADGAQIGNEAVETRRSIS